MQFGPEIKNLGKGFEGLSEHARWVIEKPYELSEEGALICRCSVYKAATCLFSEWDEISPGLEAFFMRRKALRLKMEERNLMISRLRQLTDVMEQYRPQATQEKSTVFPRPLDLTDLRMTFHFVTLPLDVPFPEARVHNLLQDLIDQWQEKRAQAVLSIFGIDSAPGSAFPKDHAIRMTRSALPPQVPLLQPPLLLFCVKCRQVITALQAMVHSCCYGLEYTWRAWTQSYPDIDGKLLDFEGDLFANACLVHSRGYLPWDHECLLPCHAIASDILRICDKDSTNRSVEGGLLETCTPRVACRRCSLSQKYLLVMGWRAAVSACKTLRREIPLTHPMTFQVLHALDEHRGTPVSWMPVAPRVASKVCAVEKLRRHQAEQEEARQASWRCLKCAYPASDIVYSKHSIEVHLFLRYVC